MSLYIDLLFVYYYEDEKTELSEWIREWCRFDRFRKENYYTLGLLHLLPLFPFKMPNVDKPILVLVYNNISEYIINIGA